MTDYVKFEKAPLPIEKRLLMVFVKNPEPGRVKTRLARTIGNDKALRVYRELLKLTSSAVGEADCERQIWYSSYPGENDMFDEISVQKKVQQGDGLGERMKYAFSTAYEEGYERVVIIGSDCPDISGPVLMNGFEQLNRTDVVIGPSEDGGYWLLGMSRFLPELFDDVAWSTPKVLPATLKTIEKNEWSVTLLEELNDIDTEEDLSRSSLRNI